MERYINSSLNEGQKYAVDIIKNFLDGKINKQFITISGPGGSGKTFLLKEALKDYTHLKIRGATVSHFAKRILQESLGVSFTVSTFASLLSMKVSHDNSGNLIMIQSNKEIDLQ